MQRKPQLYVRFKGESVIDRYETAQGVSLPVYLRLWLWYVCQVMSKKALIVDIAGGSRKITGLLPRVVRWLEQKNHDFALHTVSEPGSGRRMARYLKFEGYDRVVVLGGDGTIGEIAAGLAGSRVMLGVIPCGQSKDLAEMIRSSDGSLESACHMAFDASSREIDVGLADGFPFVTGVIVGTTTPKPSSVPIIKTCVLSRMLGLSDMISKVVPLALDVKLDRHKLNDQVAFVAVGNTRRMYGGLCLTPHALWDDGLFDVCIIKEVSDKKLKRYLRTSRRGNHIRLPGTRIYRGRRVSISSNQPFTICVDGKWWVRQMQEIEITLDKRKLKVACDIA